MYSVLSTVLQSIEQACMSPGFEGRFLEKMALGWNLKEWFDEGSGAAGQVCTWEDLDSREAEPWENLVPLENFRKFRLTA